MARPRRFVVRYQGSTPTHAGIEHIDLEHGDSKEKLLAKARELGKAHGLGGITWIQYNDWGNLQPVWNGQREDRTGDGWLYDWPGLSMAFPKEAKETQ